MNFNPLDIYLLAERNYNNVHNGIDSVLFNKNIADRLISYQILEDYKSFVNKKDLIGCWSEYISKSKFSCIAAIQPNFG